MRTIQFSYKKIIDHQSSVHWEEKVHQTTHREYFMQSQFYDPKGEFPFFIDLLQEFPQAEKLHYLVSTAAFGIIGDLKGIIPDIVNKQGENSIHFEHYRFEIIRSHIHDQSQHMVALYFYSANIKWLETMGTHLLLEKQEAPNPLEQPGTFKTQLIDITQVHLNIHSYQNINENAYTT